MDFDLSEELVAAREKIREFAKREITSELAFKYDRDEKYPFEIREKAFRDGIIDYQNPWEMLIAIEELCRQDPGMGIAATVSLFGIEVIMLFGSDRQKEKYLPLVNSGKAIMGEGPVPASRKLMAKAGLKAEDIDFWEINEAFAAVALNAMKEIGIEREKVNVKGGAIAIGHPLGATGARLAGTVSRILNEKKKDRGIATLCVGGGQGYSVLLERE